MEYYTEQFFKDYSNRMPLVESREFSDNVKDTPLSTQFDVFLSYNICDLNVVKGIFYYLSKKGLKVYLDCIVDPNLKRSSTDKETASRLKARLMKSKSLLYAQSPNAGHSNWMPWELGIVDGNTGKCYIMPVTKDATKLTPRREYLLLYPYVKPGTYNEMKIHTQDYFGRTSSYDFVATIR